MRRPWNLVVKLCRTRARLRVRRPENGVTVLIVNWNTRQLLLDVIDAVRRFSPAGTRVLVVDNGSGDGSIEALQAIPNVQVVRLPSNAGHGAALDIGVSKVRTDIVVTLDSDAIPLRDGWLDLAVDPVRSGRARIAGARSSREFAHPVYLATHTLDFIRCGWSFQIFLLPGVRGETAQWGVDAWDTGELMSKQVRPEELALIDAGPVRPDIPGGFVSDVVYHHGGVTREGGGAVSDIALRGWRDACGRLGLSFLDPKP